MIVRPMYNLVLLPDVNYYFKNDFLKDWSPVQIEAQERILFLVLRDNKPREELQPEDFYPIGVSARIDSIEEDGSIHVHTLERVDISEIEIHDGYIEAEACVRAEVDDLPKEEESERFTRIQRALLQFVQKYQWGMWARSYILQWNNMEEAVCTLTEYLNLTPDEKYQILFVTGKNNYKEIKASVHQKNIIVVDYVKQLEIMEHVDLIVCRAGATTAAEITALGTPSILIPSPYVAHNHQFYNASVLVDQHAAFMIEEKDLNANTLKEKINQIMGNRELQKTMRENALSLGKPNASSDILAWCEEMVKVKDK